MKTVSSKSGAIVYSSKFSWSLQLQLDGGETKPRQLCAHRRFLSVCRTLVPTHLNVRPLFLCTLCPFLSQIAERQAIPCSYPANKKESVLGFELLSVTTQSSANH